jgi:hypothetical protein
VRLRCIIEQSSKQPFASLVQELAAALTVTQSPLPFGVHLKSVLYQSAVVAAPHRDGGMVLPAIVRVEDGKSDLLALCYLLVQAAIV